MSDYIHLVLITNDDDLVRTFKEATELEIEHRIDTINLDRTQVSKKDIVLLDAVFVSDDVITRWTERSYFTVLIVDDYTTLTEKQLSASDIWLKSSLPFCLSKRIKILNDRFAIESQYYSKHTEIEVFCSAVRNPLGTVRGYAQVMLGGMTGELTEEQHDFVAIIESNASKLYNLVSDFDHRVFFEARDNGKR